VGIDGTYAFHGLTAGASYVVYVDGILAGAFSTPYPTRLPGPEEFWNAAAESGDGVTDDRCASSTIVPTTAGTLADVTFNKVKGAPEFIPIDLPNSSIGELSGDGQVAIGYSEIGLIRWTPSTTDLIGGDYRSPQMGISNDGQRLVASTRDGDGNLVAGIWAGGENWTPLGGFPGATSCDNDLSSGWGVSNNGTVVGLGWHDCTKTDGFKWTAASGIVSLGNLGSPDFGSSRANRISADASTIVGWDRDDFGFWQGAIWRNGLESIVHQAPAQCCDFDGCTLDVTGEASAVNPNGSIVIGSYYFVPRTYEDPGTGDVYHYCESTPWKLNPNTGLAESLGGYLPEYGLTTHAFDLSDDGGVLVGRADPFDFGYSVPVIWTAPTGWLDFQGFLAAQGTFAQDWVGVSPITTSGNGQTIGGFGFSPFSRQGFVVSMPKIVICHAPVGNPANKHTQDVVWPDGLANHLAHGDTIGLCGNGQ
jgi:probable HAF family extracellular repeat protein